jgi:endonuclease YncB( thermonuclease family)
MIARSRRHILAATAALFAVMTAASASAQPARVAYVIDGDTFRLESGERIRIAGIDAPETQPRQAKCRAEIARGEAATRNARALLNGRMVTIARVGRSYNRTVANVQLDGRDVSAVLVERGIAARWPRGRPRPNWCGD